ncbi:ATP-dependent DNA helicase pif1 [Gigaspora margarita]|uniref:ATP-dependent DNA helicase pif1 n=1 Tax=Gigaspora margarita TaxID=4874 RepID=A0A8H4AP92_GIGMA|nr:ATP-dependent DNA helicase pif1 [Gigaspora margarita]
MDNCTSCHRKLPPEAFIYENKSYKTCAECKTNRAEKKKSKEIADIDSKEAPIEIIVIDKINNYISDMIDGLEHDTALSSTFYVKLDEATFNAVGNDIRIMARLIIDEIEEGDDFQWIATTAPNISTRYEGVGNAYFVCSQSTEIEREYKDSNRKKINRFNCGGKLTIHVDILAEKAKVTLWHELIHERPINVATPPEVKQKIIENLNMDPIETGYITAIRFTTPLFYSLQNVLEIHCDATYKTSKGRFELYGIVGNFEGAGFPLAYLILDTTKIGEETQEKLQTEALEGFFGALYSKVGHLNIELTSNNLQHVEAVINNLGHAFIIITDIETAQNRRRRIPTWRGSKPWTLFLS